MRGRMDLLPRLLLRRHVHRRAKPASPSPPPLPPNPPRPPQKPEPVSIHGETWHDSYAWMGALSDAAAMRHMDLHMEAEEKYAEACLAACGADRLARKLQLEMASCLASDSCTPPVRWGPWLYYRRADEGKQYPVLCRRSAALHSEFVSYSDPSAGFDFTAGKRIEQKLVDYNKEAERFGGTNQSFTIIPVCFEGLPSVLLFAPVEASCNIVICYQLVNYVLNSMILPSDTLIAQYFAHI